MHFRLSPIFTFMLVALAGGGICFQYGCRSQVVESTSLTFRGDTAYLGDKPYTGVAYHMVPGAGKLSQTWREGKLNGPTMRYSSTGEMLCLQTYRDDSRHGPWRTYAKSGKLQEEGVFVNDVPSGIFRVYGDHGEVLKETHYGANGQIQSRKRFYPNGSLRSEQYWLDGLKNGEWRSFFENGTLHSKASYKRGHGVLMVYYRDGKIAEKHTDYRQGEDSYSDVIMYRKNGDKSEEFQVKNGSIEGRIVRYSLDGSILCSGSLSHGEGVLKGFFSNGNLRLRMTYSMNQPDGPYIQYFPNGEKKLEGEYSAGYKNGVWREYDKKGKISSKTHYVYGDVVMEN